MIIMNTETAPLTKDSTKFLLIFLSQQSFQRLIQEITITPIKTKKMIKLIITITEFNIVIADSSYLILNSYIKNTFQNTNY